VPFAEMQMALFLFSGQFFGHKPAVLRGYWLLLYIKAVAIPSITERSISYAKTM
jgi:hypothetical protein